MQQELLEAKEAKEAAAASHSNDDTTQGLSSDDNSIKINSETFHNLVLG
jgi:hypothetical protein